MMCWLVIVHLCIEIKKINGKFALSVFAGSCEMIENLITKRFTFLGTIFALNLSRRYWYRKRNEFLEKQSKM
jgi:hypothetical protein